MKKIAIVTIESPNYGNRLQNYALQQVLLSMGYSVKTLHRVHQPKGMMASVRRCFQEILQTKAAKFRHFDSNIDFSEITIGRDDYPEDLRERFDYFISGSDQVWNPHYYFAAGNCDFLNFAEPDQRVSYGASFGVSIIPEDKKTVFARYLNDFKAISVREHQGAEIVRELTGRDAEVVLDPTLLLSQDAWRRVMRKTREAPAGNYALVYALGEKNQRFLDKIESLSKDYKIFDACALQTNGRALPIGPAEFLYLIQNASIILTDSFHASVFSIIFQKPFITFNRTGLEINSRIETLAQMAGMEQCMNQFGDLVCEESQNFEMTEELLENEKEKSIAFLRRALYTQE